MKIGLAVLTAVLTAVGAVHSCGTHRLPDNYRDWLEWTPPQDRRPFLARLFSAPSMWFEVGAKKGKMHVGGEGVAGSIRNEDDKITIKDLIPEKFGVGIKFGTDL